MPSRLNGAFWRTLAAWIAETLQLTIVHMWKLLVTHVQRRKRKRSVGRCAKSWEKETILIIAGNPLILTLPVGCWIWPTFGWICRLHPANHQTVARCLHSLTGRSMNRIATRRAVWTAAEVHHALKLFASKILMIWCERLTARPLICRRPPRLHTYLLSLLSIRSSAVKIAQVVTARTMMGHVEWMGHDKRTLPKASQNNPYR